MSTRVRARGLDSRVGAGAIFVLRPSPDSKEGRLLRSPPYLPRVTRRDLASELAPRPLPDRLLWHHRAGPSATLDKVFFVLDRQVTGFAPMCQRGGCGAQYCGAPVWARSEKAETGRGACARDSLPSSVSSSAMSWGRASPSTAGVPFRLSRLRAFRAAGPSGCSSIIVARASAAALGSPCWS